MEYVGRALAYLKDDSPEELSLIKGWQGCLFGMAGDAEHAREALTQSIAIARAHGLALRETLGASNLSFSHLRQAERAERESDTAAALQRCIMQSRRSPWRVRPWPVSKGLRP